MTTEYCYSVERTESTHFIPNEDDCDDADCYQPATALLIYALWTDGIPGEVYNAVYCEAHLALTIALICPQPNPIGET